MNFKVEFTSKTLKDLKSHPPYTQKLILEETIKLETNPLDLFNYFFFKYLL